MSSKIIVEKTFEFAPDALLLCDEVNCALIEAGAEKEIVYATVVDKNGVGIDLEIVGVRVIEETLTDGSIAYNMELIAE